MTTISLRYDRAGRSDGTAFVTYPNITDARTAIREFDGANAKGQPIRLTLLPSGPGGGRQGQPGGRRDNPFDKVENPRSLFDRVERPSGGMGGRTRSASPGESDPDGGISDSRRRGARRGPPTARDRRSDVSKPPPENIDRYVPGQSTRRSPSTRNGGRDNGRRPGERRERGGRAGGGRGGGDRERAESGPRMVNGRPRKTQEELDAEMEDYWGAAGAAGGDAGAMTTTAAAPAAAAATAEEEEVVGGDDDIEMIT